MAKQNVAVELLYNGVWNDHTTDVYERDPIAVERGNGDTQTFDAPGSATFTFDNRTGKMNPRNPTSTLYGLIGQNTPCRITDTGVGVYGTDAFTRTVSGGWGNGGTGFGNWRASFNGGSAADFACTGTTGTHTVLTVSTYRISRTIEVQYPDVDFSGQCVVPVATGGNLELGVLLNLVDSNNYNILWMVVPTAGHVTAQWVATVANTGSIGAGTDTGITNDGTTPIKWRVRFSGGQFLAKVWTGATEPGTWLLTFYDGTWAGPGQIGVRSGRGAGNTNASAVFTYDNFSVTTGFTRFCGEIFQWIPGRALKGDAWTKVQAASGLRRVGRGVDPLHSAVRRFIQASDPLFYAPLEDGDTAQFASNVVDSTNPMLPAVGPSSSAAFVNFTKGTQRVQPAYSGLEVLPLGSDPLPSFAAGGSLFATLPAGTGTVSWTMRWLMRTDAAKHGGNVNVVRWTVAGGTYDTFEWRQRSSDNKWELAIYQGGVGGTRTVTHTIDYFSDDMWSVHCWARQSGGSQLITLRFDRVTSTNEVGMAPSTSTITATLGWPSGVYLNPDHTVIDTTQLTSNTTNMYNDLVIGHLSLHQGEGPYIATGTTDAVTGEFYAAMTGYIGESAGVRMLRILGEQGLQVGCWGSPTQVFNKAGDSMSMGQQKSLSLAQLTQQIEQTDDGVLYESRAFRGLVYRTGVSLLRQSPRLFLSYTTGNIAEGLNPVTGDTGVRNDVTAKSQSGAEARYVQTTGPRNTQDPALSAEAVGPYTTTLNVNPLDDNELLDIAGWRVGKGTFDGTWYASVTAELTTTASIPVAAAVLDIGDMLELDNLPEDDTPGGTVQHLVLGTREVIGNNTRQITFQLQPAAPFQVGVADTSGFLDCGGSTVRTAMDTTTVSLPVLITDSCVWTHASGDYKIMVAGEEMTVTAVGAATGSLGSQQQTLTVTRSANGVVKTHGVGEEVHVSDPFILSLAE